MCMLFDYLAVCITMIISVAAVYPMAFNILIVCFILFYMSFKTIVL